MLKEMRKNEPLVSVLMPTFNEEKHIKNIINDFLAQSIKNIELIIVDGKSTDQTQKIIKTYKNKKIKLFENKKRKTPYALNIGLNNAKGKYFIIIGAHTRVPKNFLEKNLKSIAKEPKEVVGVGGRLEQTKNHNKFGKAVDYVTKTLLGGGVSKHRYSNKKQYADTIVFGLYDRKKVGKTRFDTKFIIGQDLEFNIQLIKQGKKLLFDPTITNKYISRSDSKKLRKQMWNYGVARMKIMQKHKNTKLMNLIPLFFAAYVILVIPLSIIHWLFAIPAGLFLSSLILFSLGQPKTYFNNIKAYWIIWTRFSFGELKQLFFNKRNNYR